VSPNATVPYLVRPGDVAPEAYTNGAEPVTSYAAWPTLGAPGWHGLAGEYALVTDAYSEADPVGVLASLIAMVGATIGGGPHLLAGNDHHPPNVWPVLVGKTAARKGTAYAVARAAIAHADPPFCADAKHGGRILGGWSSGEALVDALRDADGEHPGADDKRLLVVEREYARLLNVAGRDGSTVSMHLRNAWDGAPLESRTRTSGVVIATDHHAVVVGHITPDELRSKLTSTDAVNGWANRFLWIAVRRCGRLPNGGNVPEELAAHYGRRIGEAIRQARARGRMVRTPDAEARWAEVYDLMADDEPEGMLGAIVGRAEPQCLRLALTYALLDNSPAVGVEHVDAAWAVWSYARRSAERIWGPTLGNPTADRLLAALDRNRGRLTGDEQHRALGRHISARELDEARQLLVRSGLAQVILEDTGGRPREVLVRCEKSENSETSRR
jgi:hypothetical protein